MTIDDRYGLPPLAEAFRVPTGSFPKAVQERLSRALLELPQLWCGMAFDAFRRGGAVYLRVALDLGDRPLYLFVHEDGTLLPVRSSHIVRLSRECQPLRYQ